MAGPLARDLAYALANKLVADQLVLFVGAGISYQATPKDGSTARIPLWRDLALAVAKANGDSIKEYGNDLCPLCNGKMLKRKSKFGEFWGCDSYPKCKGLRQLDGTVPEKSAEGKKSSYKRRYKKSRTDNETES